MRSKMSPNAPRNLRGLSRQVHAVVRRFKQMFEPTVEEYDDQAQGIKRALEGNSMFDQGHNIGDHSKCTHLPDGPFRFTDREMLYAMFNLLGEMCMKLWGEIPLLCLEEGYVHISPSYGNVTWHPKPQVVEGPNGPILELHPMLCSVHQWQNGKRVSPVRIEPPSAIEKLGCEYPLRDKTQAGETSASQE